MAPTDVSTWETVLDAVERDVLRTEALLALAVADLSDPVEAQVASIAEGVPTSSDPHLPSLDLMPLVPPSLLDRVQALRARVSQVRADVEVAMTANRKQFTDTTAVRPQQYGVASRYIDTVA